MPKYRKKPVEIEARQWNGADEAWGIAEWIEESGGSTTANYDPTCSGPGDANGDDWGCFEIETLEGIMQVTPRDFIIRGVQGEFYPCKPDIFDATYEPVSA